MGVAVSKHKFVRMAQEEGGGGGGYYTSVTPLSKLQKFYKTHNDPRPITSHATYDRDLYYRGEYSLVLYYIAGNKITSDSGLTGYFVVSCEPRRLALNGITFRSFCPLSPRTIAVKRRDANERHCVGVASGDCCE